MLFFKNCKKALPTWSKFFWLVIILLFLVRAFLWENISYKALYDFDEARYAEVAKNVIKTNNFLVPLAGGPHEPRHLVFLKLDNKESLYPYFWKPPFHTLTISLFYRLFGVNEFAARLPSLLSGLGILYLVYLIAKKLWPKQKLIPYISVLLLSSLSDFSFVTSYGNSDSLFLFLCLTSLYFAVIKGKRFPVLSGVFLGLAFLTKSVAVFWLPFVLAGVLILNKDKNWFRKLIKIGVTSLLVVLPWHLYMYALFGYEFVRGYFLVNTFGRLGGSAGNQAPIYWYLIYMLNYWQGLLVLSGLLIYKIFRKLLALDRDYLFLVFWISIVLVPFSSSSSKLWWYIFPMLVPTVLLLAKAISDMQIKSKKVGLILSILFVVIIAANFAFSYKEAEKRTDHNLRIKVLAKRHPKLTHLAIFSHPYESILFYFNTGNIGPDLVGAKYVVVDKQFATDVEKGFRIIDKENDLYLLKK